MAGVIGLGRGVTQIPQGMPSQAPSLMARTVACAKEVFLTLCTWSTIAAAIIGTVVVIKVVAFYPLTTVATAIALVFLYRNRHKIALLSHLYIAMLKDLIGLKKHAWFHKIDDHVVLGAIPLHIKNHPYKFQQMNVKGVLSLIDEEEAQTEGCLVRPVQAQTWQAMGVDFKHIPTSDSVPLSISQIDEAVQFVHAKAQNNSKTYICCADGASRGAIVAICYLIKHKNMTPKAAISQVKQARPAVVIRTDQLGRIYEYHDHVTT